MLLKHNCHYHPIHGFTILGHKSSSLPWSLHLTQYRNYVIIANFVNEIVLIDVSGAVPMNMSCPENYQYFGGNCYRYYRWVLRHNQPEVYRFQESWHKALRQCESENATLASIHSEEEAYFIKVGRVVIGGSCPHCTITYIFYIVPSRRCINIAIHIGKNSRRIIV